MSTGSSPAQDEISASTTVDAILAKSSSPEAVTQEITRISKENPSSAPLLVLTTLGKFRMSASNSGFVDMAKALVLAVGEAYPEVLPSVLRAVLAKYPELAIPLTSAAVAVQPSMVEALVDVAIDECPDLDISALSLALTEATGSPLGSYDYLFSGFAQSGVYIPQVGGGGSPIYR